MELPKAYDHSQVEDKIYQSWLDSGYFNPDKLPNAESREPFTISLPPPNVTGVLHLGHAFEDTIQDTVIRYQRMNGKRALWVPGTDHAAIATQAKFEKEHYKKEGKSRHEYSREDFFQMIQTFALENQKNILSQLRKLGLSMDWSRLAFTLDQNRELAVRTAFKEMFDSGLIYRGDRVVNWDPKGQTTVSDDEIEYEENKTKLYTFRYAKNFPIAISTTRPETKVGDTAVAVHPEDERYKKFIGQEFDLEFCGTPLHIIIVADKEVDPAFGTGALGVTPAHSAVDYEIAQRHNLPLKTVINEFAKMTVKSELLQGKKTAEARLIVADWLRQQGLMEKEEDTTQNLSKAQRTGGVIEPLPKLQWFINVNKKFKAKGNKLTGIKDGEEITLKELMVRVVKNKQIEIMPERFEKIYYHWIDNLRDWCISRQIIYGHQIPVWYRPTPSSPAEGRTQERLDTEKEIYCDINPPQGEGWTQDTDTLDTWFSSGLWTFSTLGWPVTNSIDFNEKLVDMVILGQKTKTYRLTDKKVNIGEIIRTHNTQSGNPFGYLKILSVNKSTLGEIDWAQAGHEQYKSQKDFFEVFKNYYPNKTVSANSEVWVYDFKFEKNSDFEIFHPTSVMMPGYEILFFWVARMILMSGFLLGDIPFHKVYLHGIVRDKQGRKFSKSLNNGVDPLEMISKYGTDALRFALVFGAAPGNDVMFDEQKIKGMKHFANKLWNISRFTMTNVNSTPRRHSDPERSEGEESQLNRPEILHPSAALGVQDDGVVTGITEADTEILTKLDATIKSVTKNLDSFNLHEAAQDIYQFTWREFADVYLEASKAQLINEEQKANTQAILKHSLIQILKLLHPFMPFITEHIWGLMQEQGLIEKNNMLIVSVWPK